MRIPFLTLCCMIAIAHTGLRAGEAITRDDLPAATKTTMETAAAGAELTDLEKTTGSKGEVVYTAKYLKDGKMVPIAVNDGGKVIRKDRKAKKEKAER